MKKLLLLGAVLLSASLSLQGADFQDKVTISPEVENLLGKEVPQLSLRESNDYALLTETFKNNEYKSYLQKMFPSSPENAQLPLLFLLLDEEGIRRAQKLVELKNRNETALEKITKFNEKKDQLSKKSTADLEQTITLDATIFKTRPDSAAINAILNRPEDKKAFNSKGIAELLESRKNYLTSIEKETLDLSIEILKRELDINDSEIKFVSESLLQTRNSLFKDIDQDAFRKYFTNRSEMLKALQKTLCEENSLRKTSLQADFFKKFDSEFNSLKRALIVALRSNAEGLFKNLYQIIMTFPETSELKACETLMVINNLFADLKKMMDVGGSITLTAYKSHCLGESELKKTIEFYLAAAQSFAKGEKLSTSNIFVGYSFWRTIESNVQKFTNDLKISAQSLMDALSID